MAGAQDPLNILLMGSEGLVYMPAEQTSELLRTLAQRCLSPKAGDDTATPEGLADILTTVADQLDLACIAHSTRNEALDKEKAKQRREEWEAGDQLVRVRTTILCPPDRAEDVASALDDCARATATRLGPDVEASGTGWEAPPPPPDEPQQRITTTPL
jgi:hypothetical protein